VVNSFFHWPSATRYRGGKTRDRIRRGGLPQITLVKNLYDNEAALKDLTAVLCRIEPDEVHISLPLRLPAEPWVEPADPDGMARAAAVLGTVARILPPIPEGVDLSASDDLVDAVIAVISRHPMVEEELVRALERWKPGDVREILSRLSGSGRAQAVTRFGRRFWSASGARYGGGTAAKKQRPCTEGCGEGVMSCRLK